MQHPDYTNQVRPWPDYWGLLCMAVALAGLGVRGLTVGCVPERTSGRNTKEGHVADALNTTGMYSIVRHPLYLGNFIIWVGVAMYCAVWWLVVIVALLFGLLRADRLRRGRVPAASIRRRLPPVGRETPASCPGWSCGGGRTSPSRCGPCCGAEYTGLFGIMATFYALKVYERVIVHRDITVEPVWTGMFAAGVLIYLTLATIKHQTRLLIVAGR